MNEGPLAPEIEPLQDTPETVPSPERSPTPESERPVEQPEQSVRVEVMPEEHFVPGPAQPPVQPSAPAATAVPAAVDPLVTDVERILADGLSDLYLTMDSVQQERFRLKGEETAREIAGLLQRTKFQAKKILSLIATWLRLIPQVNAYFLEKEAQLRFDRIIQLHETRQRTE